MLSIGVDGCRAGWLAIELVGGQAWRYRVLPRLEQALPEWPEDCLILVDMPLGLLDGVDTERECDRLARRALGWPRSSSVFSPPARPTLAAGDYAQAQQINRRCVGKGLSRQAWNLVPKIRELDQLRCMMPGMAGRLRESHPEVCFRSLNQQRAPQHNKKTGAGREERLNILQHYRPDARKIVSAIAAATLRKDVAWDDIIDALVLAISAGLAPTGLNTLPEVPPRDHYGIAMEIVCPKPE
jgi:predicted RNase H-like nuclease